MANNEIRRVNLSRIPKEKRREAMNRLEQKHPGVAATIKDPFFQAIREHFNADVIVELPVKKGAAA